jgi:hypothetical protein
MLQEVAASFSSELFTGRSACTDTQSSQVHGHDGYHAHVTHAIGHPSIRLCFFVFTLLCEPLLCDSV